MTYCSKSKTDPMAVAMATKLISEGRSHKEVAAALNASGYKSATGKPFTHLSAYNLLKKREMKAPAFSPLILELARAAVRSKSGTAEERLAAVQSFLG